MYPYPPNMQRKQEHPYTRNVGLFSNEKSNIDDISQAFSPQDVLLSGSVSLCSGSSSSRGDLKSSSEIVAAGRGLRRVDTTTPLRQIPEMIHIAPFQVYSSIRNSVKGANTNPPTPLPHTAIPVASARFFLEVVTNCYNSR